MGASCGHGHAETSSDLQPKVSFRAAEHDGEHNAHSKKGHAVSMAKIVHALYERVLADPKLQPFFEGIDMDRLRNQQTKLMALAFGGEDLLKEEAPNMDMRKVHWRLIKEKGLGLEHFDLFVVHFKEVMEELAEGIPAESREAGLKAVQSMRPMFAPAQPDETH